jgi:hypothetical protein
MNRFDRLRLERNIEILREAWGFTSYSQFRYGITPHLYEVENIVFGDRPPIPRGAFNRDGRKFIDMDTGHEETCVNEVHLIKNHKR